MKKGVIITGGSHGIGHQMCLDFLAANYQVTMIDLNSCDIVHQDLYFYQGDIKQVETLEQLVVYAMEKMGRIDVLINNACYGKGGILNQASYADFDEVLSVGLKAPYYLSLLCKEELIKNEGHIINIASSRAFQSEPNSEAYASAKGGIVALTHALAMSLSPSVLVNCIAPGWINVRDDQISEDDLASIPAGKVGTPSDISSMALYLCHQTFITGETITVDGGMNKCMIYHNEWNWSYHKEKD